MGSKYAIIHRKEEDGLRPGIVSDKNLFREGNGSAAKSAQGSRSFPIVFNLFTLWIEHSPWSVCILARERA